MLAIVDLDHVAQRLYDAGWRTTYDGTLLFQQGVDFDIDLMDILSDLYNIRAQTIQARPVDTNEHNVISS